MADNIRIPACEAVNADSKSTDYGSSCCSLCYNSLIQVRCSRCHQAYYCSEEHQQAHWKFHKENCGINYVNSNETILISNNATLDAEAICQSQKNMILSDKVVNDLNYYGFCVIPDYLGARRGSAVLHQVINLYYSGVFSDGQLMGPNKVASANANRQIRRIRGDKIAWIDGSESGCDAIKYLSWSVDALVSACKGRFGNSVISGRTKCMVACYPGDGMGYVRHVDNPKYDGRRITALYYLNPTWNSQVNGGQLWLYPNNSSDAIKIDPLFDRLLLFWSDRRNPHEVKPAFAERYAITIWYFDEQERAMAAQKFK